MRDCDQHATMPDRWQARLHGTRSRIAFFLLYQIVIAWIGLVSKSLDEEAMPGFPQGHHEAAIPAKRLAGLQRQGRFFAVFPADEPSAPVHENAALRQGPGGGWLCVLQALGSHGRQQPQQGLATGRIGIATNGQEKSGQDVLREIGGQAFKALSVQGGVTCGIDHDMLNKGGGSPSIGVLPFSSLLFRLIGKSLDIEPGLAEPVSGEAGAVIARIIDPGLGLGLEMALQACFVDAEKRAEQAKAGKIADGGHGREAGITALPSPSDRHGFRLIPAVMSGQEVKTALPPAPVGKEGIACFPGAMLQAGARLVAGPGDDVMLDPAVCEPVASFSGLLPRAGPEPVIDGQPDDPAAPLPCPVISEQGERQAVGTAGDCYRQKGSGFEGAKVLHASGENGGLEGPPGPGFRIVVMRGPEGSLRLINAVVA